MRHTLSSYLSTQQVQERLFELLVVFDHFCSENDLRYSLDGGTLLGAVRHHGFIPWDDDIDVMMPRPDYNRFLSESSSSDENYMVQKNITDAIELPFAKLVDRRFRAQENSWEGIMDEYLWIDIFPVDGLPDEYAETKALLRKQHHLLTKASALSANPSVFKGLKGLVKRAYRFAASPFRGAGYYYKVLADNAMRYDFDNSNYVCQWVWHFYDVVNRIPHSDFDNLVELSFNGNMFKSIPSWDAYLTATYGDYMQMPPVEMRQSHTAFVWPVG